MKNAKKWGIVIGIVVGIVGCVVLAIVCKDITLFQYNIMDILTVMVVSLGLYFLNNLNDEKKRKNKKIEELLDELKKRLVSFFMRPVDKDKKEEYLHTFKYIYNKISVIKVLASHIKCADDIVYIENEIKKIDVFINENISQGNAYFERQEVKEKIPNIICNVESKIDDIILKLYNVKKK